MTPSSSVFLAIFAACALVGAMAFSVGQMTMDNYQCRSTQFGHDQFMAYCRSEKYGDYEHGAVYYGLEPGIGASIRDAQVIFVGDSETQAAFSTEAVRAYFKQRRIRFFVMGFGYGESSTFAAAVLNRWKASPKLIVVNADPTFFSNNVTGPGRQAIDGRPSYLWLLLTKALFQRVGRVLAALSYPQSEPAIFRSARDGEWNWVGSYIAEQARPVKHVKPLTISDQRLELAKIYGEKFIAAARLERRCIVLTATPTSDFDSTSVARKIADLLGTPSIFPTLDHLATLDGTHLNRESAERWSGAFLQSLSPILSKCIVH